MNVTFRISAIALAAMIVQGCCGYGGCCGGCPAPCWTAQMRVQPAAAPQPAAARPDEGEQAPAAKDDASPAKAQPKQSSLEAVLMKKRVRGLSWENSNLDQAASYLRTISGANFYISPKVREEKFEDITITLQVDDVTLHDLIGVLTEPYGLRWEVRDDVVWILTKEEIEGAIDMRMYDVADLVTAGAGTPEEMLADIRTNVFPSYWDRDDVSLEAKKNMLIVRASAAVHAGINEHLSLARTKLEKPGLDEAMKAKLDAIKVNLAVSNQTLSDVIKTLQIQTGLNLAIDPRIAADVKDNPITGMKLTDTPVTTALSMLASAAGEHCLWINRGSVIFLTLPEFAASTPR